MLRSCLSGFAFVCAGCASSGSSPPMAAVPNCAEFTSPATINGQTQQLVGLACQLPDGTWTPVEAVPGLSAAPGYAVEATTLDAGVAPNCAYPMAAQYTKQCNLYLPRHRR
jgi:hypothetical protein